MTETLPNEQAIFETARHIESADARNSYLRQMCGEDVGLAQRVHALLAAHEDSASFLKSPPPEVGSSPTLDQPVTEKPGAQIGPYKLLQQIGEGGMGVVYMAEQTEPIGRRVALKIIKPGMDTRQVIARFEAERQALAMMDHPSIAKVFDAGTTGTGRPYFVMELVKGVPITQYCDEHQLSPRERLELFLPACQAVQHAHQKGIIHRDIKPTNVMVAHYDDRPVPKIIDFGVAKAVVQRLTEKTLFTEFGQVVGTVEYMSPEQARLNQQDIDTRSDVYSLGVLLYELLTGETPFDGKRLRSAAFDELLRIIREEEPPRPSQKLSTSQSLPSIAANRHLEPKQLSTLVHGELDWIVMKALEKDRTRRYDTASKFAEDVQHYLNDEEVAACPPSAAYKFRKFARKYKAAIATTLAIAAALIVGISMATWQAIQASRERDRAVIAEAATAEEAERAIAAEGVATSEAENAEQQRRQARREQYFAETVAGQTELASENLGGLYTRLINYLPMDGEEDHRDWEWYYLMSRCRQEERTLTQRSGYPYAAWSSDGQLIGAPTAIWRADTGEQIRQFNTSHVAQVRVAWSLDASKFAWCMTKDEDAFYVWDRPSDQVTRFAGHKHSVKIVAWSPDGSKLASSSHDNTVKVWDAATGTVLWTSPDLGNAAYSLDWSPDGKLLALGMHWQGVKVWDTLQRESVYENLEKEIELHQVNWHPNGDLLAVSNSKSWYVLNRDDWSMTHQHNLLRGGQAIAYSPDGSRIAVTDGEAIEVWESDGETKLTELNGHLAPVISISWAPDGHRLVTADNVKDIKLWDLDHFVDKPTIAIGGPLQSLVWLDDQRTLVTVSQEDGSSSWWDAEKGSLQNTEEPMVPMPFQLSPDRRLAAVREQDQPTLTILDAASGNKQATLQLVPERTLQSFAFSSDSNRVVVQSFAKQRSYLDFWKIDEPQPAGTWEWHRPFQDWTDHRLFTWESQGSRLASIGKGDQGDNGSIFGQDHLLIFDADTGERLLKWNPAGRGKTTCLAWSQDGRYLAMGTDEGRLEVVDLESQRQRFSKKLHRHGITSVAWHPRGNRLACGTEDRSVKIISSTDAGLLLNIPVPDGPPVQLAWNEEGRSLAAATNTGHIYTWSTRRAYEITPDGQRRSELAWAYYDRARRASGKEKQAALRAFLQYAPDSLAFWKTRGNVLAQLGRFEEAAQEYFKEVEPNIQHAFEAAYYRAFALLAAGKMEEYRDACAQLVEGFQDSPVPSNHKHIAWLCVLTPSQEVDWQHKLNHKLAYLRREDTPGNDNWKLSRAAVLFRSDYYDDTIDALTKLIAKLDHGSDRTGRFHLACSQYFLAMALFKTNDTPRAIVMLADANQNAEFLQGTDAFWQNLVTIKTLRQEAESLIRNDKSDAGEPRQKESGKLSNN